MSIGTTIKRLRRERDMTQEQLADYLGISIGAVSQWECDRTAPDISQLPMLAHVFEVSADVLLGIDTELANKKIADIIKTAFKMNCDGEWEKESEYLREQLKTFPRAYSIMEELANAIVNDYSRKGIKDYDEVISLCGKVLNECTDNDIRYRALTCLGTAYYYAGKTDDMMKIAEQMVPFQYSKESFLLYKLKGDKAFVQYREYFAGLTEQILSVMELLAGAKHDDGTAIYSAEDSISLREQAVGLLEILYLDGDYQIKAQHAEIACSFISQAYFRAQDIGRGFEWLNKASDFAICFDTYDFNSPHTSPVQRGYIDGGWIMENGRNRSAEMIDGLLSDEEMSGYKSDSRFIEIIDKLRKTEKRNET